MLLSAQKINQVVIDKKIFETISEFNNFFGIEFKDVIVIIVDLETFYAICCNNNISCVAITISQTIFVCDYECIKDRYSKEEYINLLRHEIAHIYTLGFLKYNKNVPTWFKEGVAVYLSNQVVTRKKAINIITLFNADADGSLFYNGAGIFIEYLVEKYGKEKFLKFLLLLKNLSSKKNINRCFCKIYNKSLIVMLQDLLKINEINNETLKLVDFKKFIKNKVNDYILEYGKFLNYESKKISIPIKGFLEKKNNRMLCILYIKCASESTILGDNLYIFNPKKSYYKLSWYLNDIKFLVGKIVINKYCNNNPFIPIWLSCGFAWYFVNKDDILLNKSLKIDLEYIFDDSTNIINKVVGGGVFVKYLIDRYTREVFLKFIEMLKNIRSIVEVNAIFKKVYIKDIKEVLNEKIANKTI